MLKNIDKKQALKLYKQMQIMRKMEERIAAMYGMGYINGFCHLYIGQEAVLTGLHSLANKQDSLMTTYRTHAHTYISGIEPKYVMAELTGRATGCSKGKGGSMHMFNKKGNFYGGHGIVGSSVPIGAGLAFAHKYLEDKGVSFVYFGDGASHQGQVAETFNMASLWKLPALFVLENNQYSMGTSNARSSANVDYSLKGVPYSIPSLKVDGMDILDVIEKGKQALEHIRSGKGPFLLDIWTYRYRGHSMSDPANYRSKEEVADIKENRDAIKNFGKLIVKEGVAKEEDLQKIDKEVKKIIDEGEKFATESPYPEEQELYTDVLIES